MSLNEITELVSPLEQDALVQNLLKHFRENNIAQPGMKMLLAVSGGVDSSVLAHLMSRAQRLLSIELALVHVDHAQRGVSSEREALWVEVLASRLNLPFHSIKLEVLTGLSQDELRRYRRLELEELREKLGFDLIATAHHADDNAETLLIRAIQGSGVQGLRGMRVRDGVWCKPLLFARRDQLVDYARKQSLGWVEDPSNQRDAYLRNRLRNEAFPLLEEIRKGATANLARLAQRTNQEEEEWEVWLAKELKDLGSQFPLSYFDIWPKNLLRRALRFWLEKIEIEALPALIEALLTGEELVHERGVFLRRSDHIIFSPERDFGKRWDTLLPVALQQRVMLGSSVAWSFLDRQDVKKFTPYELSILLHFRSPQSATSTDILLNWDNLPSKLALRKASSSEMPDLRRYFEKANIPRPFQREWPLLVALDSPREKICVLGLHVFERYAYQSVGRCVALESFFEQRLSPQIPS
jgi:tRNA(Ile)-lysidine synthetase-like protein